MPVSGHIVDYGDMIEKFLWQLKKWQDALGKTEDAVGKTKDPRLDDVNTLVHDMELFLSAYNDTETPYADKTGVDTKAYARLARRFVDVRQRVDPPRSSDFDE